MYVYIYIYIHIHAYVCRYVGIYIHTHTHIHTCIRTHQVEGILIFTNKALRDMMNLKIYVDVEADRRILRR
jgi:uridine kinase